MLFHATIKVSQTYEIEADDIEQAEHYFRNRGIDCPEGAIYNDPDWETIEMEEA